MPVMIDFQAIANLRQTLFECINNALSESTEVRRVAEEKIAALEVLEEFPIHLIEISLDKGQDLAVRQMSSVLLKQFMDAYWSTRDEDHMLSNFVLRSRIRRQLLEGLREPNSKLRNTFAYCVSYVGSLDFPEKWLTFFGDLHGVSMQDSKYGVYGVLRVYQDVIRDSVTLKINYIARPLLNEICFILIDRDKYDIQARICAVHVLCLLVNLCSSQNLIRSELNTKLIPLCEYFVSVLQVEENDISDYGLKTNIIRFFTLMVQKAARLFAPFLMCILPVVWQMVMHYGDIYLQSVVNSRAINIDIEDEEGKVIGYTPLVLAIFDLIHSLVDNERVSIMLHDVLNDLIYYIIVFMHITKNIEEAWLAEPLTFVEDDEREHFDASIRITARDVLMMICNDFSTTLVIPAFSQAVNRHTNELEWKAHEWKTHECLMFAMGCIKDLIIRESFEENLHFPFYEYTTSWLFALKHPELSLLVGRALWYSGKFSPLLTDRLFDSYMQATLDHLKDNDAIIKVFAIRSVIGHSENFVHNRNKNTIISKLPEMFESILENLSKETTLSYLLTLNLSTLKITLSIGSNYTESLEDRIMTLIIDILMKFHSDPDVVNEICHIVKTYCRNDVVSTSVQNKLLPILSNILSATDDKVPYGFKTIAMDLLQAVIKSTKPPISDSLLLLGFPATVKCVINTDDHLVMSSGGECIQSYLLLGAEQISNFRDPEGTGGLQYVLRVITHLLDPAHSQEACKRIGRLIITLINKTGAMLGNHLHFLLRAILSKMQRVEQLEIWQSLLMVFIFLFYTELEFVLNFLSSVPGPAGQSALEFVLLEWIHRQNYFVGTYDRTASVAALTKLLEFKVTSEDIRFDTIMVRDIVISDAVVPQEPIEIPVLAKAFKIVCSELAYYIEKNTPSEPQTDDGDENPYEDSDSSSDISDYRYYDEPNDQDAVYCQDPIFGINILPYLTDFMLKFKNIPRFQWYVSFLNCKEKNALASIEVF